MISPRSRRSGRARRGVAAVELAICLPILMLLAVGVIDFGRLYITGIAATGAVSAGAQFAAREMTTSRDTAAINRAVMADFPAALGPVGVRSERLCRCGAVAARGDACTTTLPSLPGCDSPRVLIEVTDSVRVGLLLRYPGMPDSILVRRRATIRVQ